MKFGWRKNLLLGETVMVVTISQPRGRRNGAVWFSEKRLNLNLDLTTCLCDYNILQTHHQSWRETEQGIPIIELEKIFVRRNVYVSNGASFT